MSVAKASKKRNASAASFVLVLALAACCWSWCCAAADEGFQALVADRKAVEKVYYDHRMGTKAPFEEVLPRAQVERLVNRDLEKERVLEKTYGINITDADVEAEARRIDEATRAPDVLAELKTALDNDPVRFGRTVVRPIVVENKLREHFESDPARHASERRKMEEVRADVLEAAKARASVDRMAEILREKGVVHEAAWRVEEANGEAKTVPTVARSANYSAEAVVTPDAKRPGRGEEWIAFEKLRPELQALLRAQLQKAGDVSAVVETDTAFTLFLARERSGPTLRVCALSIPKANYELWLNQQNRPDTDLATRK